MISFWPPLGFKSLKIFKLIKMFDHRVVNKVVTRVFAH